MLAQRASWFRLLPMRAIWLVRSRSTDRADAVHLRVRAIASRSRAEGETPTELPRPVPPTPESGAWRRVLLPTTREAGYRQSACSHVYTRF